MIRIGLPLLALALAAGALVACGGGNDSATLSPASDPTTQIGAEAPADAPPAADAPAPAQEPASSTAEEPPAPEQPFSAPNAELEGVWQIYSARIFYDEGGGGTVDTTITRELELDAYGNWYFGASAGTYEISDVSADDWGRWGVEPYGPARKITLFDWNGGAADGPIEESGTGVDFLWVIYYEGPPTISAPGTVWMKFGHA